MKENFTSINVVMDKSGSMGNLTDDTIGSFNTFLKEQKEFPGEAVFTLCTFNHESTFVHDAEHIANVQDLNIDTYRPNGNTALLDALGQTIDRVGKNLAAMPEADRPSKVIFLVITDGEENSSRMFDREQIKSMVEHQKSVYNWEFMFFGANVDAFTAGTSMGFAANNSIGYNATAAGTEVLYRGISSNVSNYRSS